MTAPMPVSHREIVQLPVGFEDGSSGKLWKEAEVRAITGADEIYVGMSPEYSRYQNDLIFKALLLSRAVVRLGERTMVTFSDIKQLHAQDLRVLEDAVFRLTYGTETTSRVRCPDCGRVFEAELGGPSG